MAKNLRPPDKLVLEGNLKENFRKCKQQFELYLTATAVEGKEDKVKSSTLLTIIGPEALEEYNTFQWTEEGDADGDNIKCDKILQKFENYCNPRKNVAYERHVFNKRDQKDGETIDGYVTDLRILASSCEYGDLKESLIRDRMVCGIQRENIRLRLLRENDLDLQKAIDICRASEASEQQIKSMANSVESSVNIVRKTKSGYKPQQKRDTKAKFSKCGSKHEPRKCPAYGKKSHECDGLNHFAKMCRNKKSKKKVRSLKTSSSEDEFSDTELLGVLYDTVNAVNKSDWSVPCIINKKEIQVLVDTGARCNVISAKMLKKLKIKAKLSSTRGILRSFSGHTLKQMGSVSITCEVNNKTLRVKVLVVHEKEQTILGGETSETVGLVKKLFSVENEKKDILEKYEDVFKGIGCLPGKHRIYIDPEVKPVVHPPRRIPIKLREKVKAELERMEKEHIIIRETEPTEWLSSMVTVVKPNGNIRICLDPKDLNRAIKRQHYPLKTVEEVTSNMPGAKYFSKLDAVSSFWLIELEEESSKLCTFNTPYGRYRYLRLPFGVHSSLEVMQQTMCSIMENIEGTDVIMDDIILSGKILEEHD